MNINRSHITSNNNGLLGDDFTPFILITEILPWKHGVNGNQMYRHRIVDVRHAPKDGLLGAVMATRVDKVQDDEHPWLYNWMNSENFIPPEYLRVRLTFLSKHWHKINSNADYRKLWPEGPYNYTNDEDALVHKMPNI